MSTVPEAATTSIKIEDARTSVLVVNQQEAEDMGCGGA